jgi:adenylate cyclase
VTVLFADLVDFTRLAARISASEVVQLLNEVFSQFDWLAELHRLEKIKTIGDAYMVVGGLPMPQADHAVAVAEMALDMQKVVGRMGVLGGMKFICGLASVPGLSSQGSLAARSLFMICGATRSILPVGWNRKANSARFKCLGTNL